MGKRENIVIISALVAALAVIVIGVMAGYYLEREEVGSFDSITGNVIRQPCSDSFYLECNGECPDNMMCLPDPSSGSCLCTPIKNEVYCENSMYPVCGGYCSLGLECKPSFSSGECKCTPIDVIGESVGRISSSCSPNFECTEWSSCLNGEQSRICVDMNECSPQKEEKRKCSAEAEPSCIADWNCSFWSNCENNQQTRTCYDMNMCNNNENKPEEVRECAATPTVAAIADKENLDKKENILTPTLKTGIIALSLILSITAIVLYLFIKKPKTVNKTVAVGISLFIILGISGLVYFSYEKNSQIEITANAVAIDNIIPAVKSDGITNNMFLEVFDKMSPLKKAGVVNILIIISTLIFIMALILNKKR